MSDNSDLLSEDHPEPAQSVALALEAEDRARLLDAIEAAHPADIADALEQVSAADRANFVTLTGSAFPLDVLAELEEGARDELLERVAPELLANAVTDLDSDDAVYVVENLTDTKRKDVLDALSSADRMAIERSLEYPEDSAGRIMQRELVSAPPFWSVGQMIDFMRAQDDLPSRYYDIIIIDPSHKPVGTVALSRLMAERRAVILEDIMEAEFRTVNVLNPQEEVAYLFNQYHLVTAPVVDGTGRLSGVITIDDALEVLDDESEEDLMRLGGVGDEELSDSVSSITRQRLPWLLINLVTAILASFVIAQFDEVIGRIVALAILMTIVASMGGNAGTQTMTVAVRALATKDLTRTNAWRIIRRETAVGLINGIFFGIIMGFVTWVWYGDPALGGVLGAAMIMNMLIAALAGILIPIGLEKIGSDPALSSAVFVTTVTDVIGFLAFLGLATLILL